MYHCESSSLLLVLSLLLACLEICGSPSHRPESRRQKEFQLSDLIPELRTYPELMPCEEEEQTRSRRPRHIPDEIRLGSKRGDKEKEEEEEEEEEEDVPWSQLLKDSRRAQLLSSSFIEMQAGLQQGNETEDEEASELAAVEAQQGDGDRSRVKSKFLSHRAEQIVLRSVANHKESPRAFISALSSLAPGLLEAMDKNLDVTLEGGTFFSFLQSIVIDGKINIRGQNSSSKVYTTWTLTEGSAGKLQGCSLVWTASNDLDEVQTVLMRGSSWQFEGCRLFCGGDCALRVENGELASSNPVPDCVVLDSIKTMLSHKPSVVSLVDCEIGGLDDDNMNVKEKNTLHAFAYSGINLRDDSECVMQRSRIRGMEGFAVRLEDFSGLHMANCEITKSPVGILARDSCKLLLDGCTLQNMSFGGALVCSSSAEVVVRCTDFKFTSCGISMRERCKVEVISSSFILCSLCALLQVEDFNNVSLLLKSNSFYLPPTGKLWLSNFRPYEFRDESCTVVQAPLSKEEQEEQEALAQGLGVPSHWSLLRERQRRMQEKRKAAGSASQEESSSSNIVAHPHVAMFEPERDSIAALTSSEEKGSSEHEFSFQTSETSKEQEPPKEEEDRLDTWDPG